jgi:hypothetical protein
MHLTNLENLKKKNNFCGFSTMVQNPLKIQENISKIFFLGIYPGTKSPFLRPKNFPNFFWLHLVPGTTIEKKIKNTGSTWYQIRGLPVYG